MPIRQHDCPFYGLQLVERWQLLIEQIGNECGLRTLTYAPCSMEVAGLQPDLATCPTARDSQALIAIIRETCNVARRHRAIIRFAEYESGGKT
jgi:hypothetical protein